MSGPGSDTDTDTVTDRKADTSAVSTTATEVVQRIVEEEHGYLSWLGTRVDDIEHGRVVLTVPYDEKLTNSTDPPTVNGGIAATSRRRPTSSERGRPSASRP